MAASGLNMNWSTVSVDPDGATAAVSLTKVTNIIPEFVSNPKKFFGDAVKFPQAIVNVEKSRRFTIVGGDLYKLLTLPEDLYCTITATHNDAENGVTPGDGAILFTAIKAKRISGLLAAPNNEFGQSSVVFECKGGTSDADPITISLV